MIPTPQPNTIYDLVNIPLALTNWRAKGRHCVGQMQLTTGAVLKSLGDISEVQMRLTTEATHLPESQGQVSLEGPNPAHNGRREREEEEEAEGKGVSDKNLNCDLVVARLIWCHCDIIILIIVQDDWAVVIYTYYTLPTRFEP